MLRAVHNMEDPVTDIATKGRFQIARLMKELKG